MQKYIAVVCFVCGCGLSTGGAEGSAVPTPTTVPPGAGTVPQAGVAGAGVGEPQAGPKRFCPTQGHPMLVPHRHRQAWGAQRARPCAGCSAPHHAPQQAQAAQEQPERSIPLGAGCSARSRVLMQAQAPQVRVRRAQAPRVARAAQAPLVRAR